MTPPTPAAVRYALRTNYDDTTLLERGAYLADERDEMDLLSDHIRAIAQEMRAVVPDGSVTTFFEARLGTIMHEFADKLEGREP